MNSFISYPEPKLILCKDNPITYKRKIKGSETYLLSLNPNKILTNPNDRLRFNPNRALGLA